MTKLPALEALVMPGDFGEALAYSQKILHNCAVTMDAFSKGNLALVEMLSKEQMHDAQVLRHLIDRRAKQEGVSASELVARATTENQQPVRHA